VSNFALADTFSEAIRNLRASPFNWTIRAVLAAAISCGTMLATLGQVSEIERRFDDGVAAGRFVWKASVGNSGQAMSAARCDALQGVTGVIAGGSVLKSAPATPSTQPLARYDLVDVTPGLVRVYWPAADNALTGSGVIAGAYVAQQLGLVAGGEVLLHQVGDAGSATAVPVEAVMPPSLREPFSDRRLYRVAPPQGSTDSCFVEARPQDADGVAALMRSWFPVDLGVTVTPVRTVDPLAQTPEAELRERLSGWAWILGSSVIALTTLLVWYARRADLALYRLLGLTVPRSAMMLTVDHVLATVLPLQVGLLLGLAIGSHANMMTGLAGELALIEALALSLSVFTLPPLYVLWTSSRRSALDSLRGQ
jgi:hypothetical protein